MKRLLSLILLFSSFPLLAQELMPPLLPWSGKSESLIVEDSNPWVTPGELTDLTESPTYTETMDWLRKLANSSPYLEMKSLGKSEQGRDIYLLVASKSQKFSPEDLAQENKATLFFHGGIHAGEIDGKDVGMMLLRDILHGEKMQLLDEANILFIPILNVDGHERRSEFGRVNQRGPKEMGWRTNARNLNLNRDFTKIETAGVKAVIDVLNSYQPDLYVDVHVTDGADYQYDVTYGYVKTGGYSPAISQFLSETFQPEVDQALKDWGHIPGPLLFAANGDDFSEGNIAFSFSPRFSHTYGDARHIPSILIENHSLKPFRQRVLGTYAFLEQAIRTIAKHYPAVQNAIISDQNQEKESIAVKFKFREAPADTMDFLGIASKKVRSEITGAEYVVWEGKAINQQVPSLLMDVPVQTVPIPKAYWISSEWGEVIEKLQNHGVEMEILDQPREVKLEYSKVTDFKMGSQPYEGLMRVQEFASEKIYRSQTFLPGSVRIKTDQDLGELIVILLEPESVDSFFQWGFFNTIFAQTEYMETYIMEPMIAQMLEKDANLKAAFEEKMSSDPEFAKNPRRIYRWFYEKTPYFDQNWKVIPVGREW
ncbi:M14 family metallopeptidase [Algoriphagus limi]|uniref:M14 family metallopeptidase n=1 Tax=Algoriphagus limi TaxID=2975273 RepID=A0ABT2G5Y8_9BACT|nr:M14 family metallopeptidase [Algoriphagus limi]MCS5490678.1 M14 family metallopeptidase [Algoriphagus limi]